MTDNTIAKRKGTKRQITRYNYNLMIMESPKPATDNKLKK